MSRRLAWLYATSLCFYAAVTIGDNVAQSIFISHLGVGALPTIFLIKAAIDVVSALLYLPLTRAHNPRRVWLVIMLLYSTTVASGWWLAAVPTPSTVSVYWLYAGHEVVWTLAIIHWGVFLLDIADASESRRLFPKLFGVGRLGALLGGLVTAGLALKLGAANLLWGTIGLGLASGVCATRLRSTPRQEQVVDKQQHAWRSALGSPLIRIIALSTATMVVLRYGLRMVSLAEIRQAFDHDADQVAAFLGLFSVLGNGAAFLLGLYVIPRLLARVGVSTANLIYAGTTIIAFLASWLSPNLLSATGARFVERPLKHSLKTPVSVLFYGAETPSMRLAGRSFIFGLAIPIAAVFSGLSFRRLRSHLDWICIAGVVVGILYLLLCHIQNRRYRERLAHLLGITLNVADTHQPETLQTLQAMASALPQSLEVLIARGLDSEKQATRGLALALLTEHVPKKTAEALRRRHSNS